MSFVRNRDVRQQEAHVLELKRNVDRARLDCEMVDTDDSEAVKDANEEFDKAKKALSEAKESLKDMKKDVKKFNSLFRK